MKYIALILFLVVGCSPQDQEKSCLACPDIEPSHQAHRHEGALNKDAEVEVPDAEIVDPDARIVEPDAEIVEPDAEIVEPDAEMVEPDAEIVEPDAQIVEPDARIVEPDAEIVEPDAQIVEPDARIVEPDAEIQTPDAEVFDPDAEIVEPDAQIVEPDAEIVEPDAEIQTPDAEVFDPDAEVEPPCLILDVRVIARPVHQPHHLVGTMVGFQSDRSPFHGEYTTHWTVEAPAHSTCEPWPWANVPNPIFLFDVPGEYTITLNVDDDCGLTSMEWVYNVLPIPTLGLKVVLVWGHDENNDEGQFPHGGADLDLHLAHPFATSDDDQDGDGEPDPWFDEPWDCGHNNGNPNWGVQDRDFPDDPHNHPRCSPGPEITDLVFPEDVEYRIGVHHFAYRLERRPPTWALLTVFWNGQKTAQENMNLEYQDMWCVGLVNGMTGALTPCPMNDPVTPDYQYLPR